MPCTCTRSYGTKLKRYQWRQHLQGAHAECLTVLYNLVDDLQNASLAEWLSKPEADRLYIVAQPPAAAAAAPPAPAAPPGAGDAAPGASSKGPAADTQQPPVLAPTAPSEPPAPCLQCPYACGVEALRPGADFAAHMTMWHAKELQVLAALQDGLVLRAGKANQCPWHNVAPLPCRRVHALQHRVAPRLLRAACAHAPSFPDPVRARAA